MVKNGGIEVYLHAFTSRRLYTGEIFPATYWIGGWVGPEIVLVVGL
jgi:hypothetical protein